MESKKQRIELGRLRGARADDAVEELRGAGIATAVVTHELPGPLATLLRLGPPPQVRPGDHVKVIVSGDQVVGFELDHAAALAALRDRVERLERAAGGKG